MPTIEEAARKVACGFPLTEQSLSRFLRGDILLVAKDCETLENHLINFAHAILEEVDRRIQNYNPRAIIIDAKLLNKQKSTTNLG